MKTIKLSNSSRVAMVDAADFEQLSQYHWRLDGNGYAVKGKFGEYMHRFIMTTPNGLETDHLNRDRLDNRRVNLKICTKAENQQNRGKNKNNRSGFKGVYPHKMTGKWGAERVLNGTRYYLGLFSTAEEASRAYQLVTPDKAAK